MENKELAVIIDTYVPIVRVEGSGGMMLINKLDDETVAMILSDLEDQFISSQNLMHSEHAEDIEKKIVKWYLEYLERNGKVPSLDILYEDAVEYNLSLCYQMADIDFANDYNDNYSDEIAEDEDIDIDDWLGQICDNWCEYENDQFQSIDEAVKMVLDKFYLSYYESCNNKVYLAFQHLKQAKLVYNDAQNMINPEWMAEGISHLSSYFDDIERVKVVIENE